MGWTAKARGDLGVFACREGTLEFEVECDDDAVYYYIGERLKLERETENSGV